MKPSRRQVVDLNDGRTWPAAFADFVRSSGAEFDAEQGCTSDQEREAIGLLAGHLVRAFHCTRLTDREIRSIRREGLVPLSPGFTRKRLMDAVADGFLTQEQANVYGDTSVADEPSRRGVVCLFTDRSTLKRATRVGYLLECWGGEGITMGVRSHTPAMDVLERIGRPTVVVASLDLTIHCIHAHPGVLQGAVQRLLRCNDQGTEIRSAVSVSGSHVESIEHPRTPFWERYVWTPSIGYRYLPAACSGGLENQDSAAIRLRNK